MHPLQFCIGVLAACSPCLAWDDDDAESKPFHQSNYNHQNSATDYGYKNNYQANPTRRTSAIDFGGPKRLAQADDDAESKPFHRSNYNQQNSANDYSYKNPYQANSAQRASVIDFGGPKRASQEDDYVDPKRLISPQQQHDADRASSIRVPSVQESVALRDRESKKIMAESQRSFERQEAQQEKSRAQMAKQQEIYDEMDREECEMAEFLGGVYKAKFGATTGRNSAVTSDGYVYRSGNNFITPKGIYTKSGNTYAGPGSFTTQTGTLFFGNESTTIQAGGAYFSDGESGYIVGPNCRNTSTWRTR